MKDSKKKFPLKDHVSWVFGWVSTLVGLVAVLSMLTLGTCAMARSSHHTASVSLHYYIHTARSVDIWQTIRKMVDSMSKGPGGTQQVGATRLWTSRYDDYPCVCWSASNPTPPPYSSCLSIATLDPKAHPCTPFHPATDGWVKRPMDGIHKFSGNRKVYRHSGFYVDLPPNEDFNKIVDQYEKYDWLDWSSHAVVLEALLYEPYTACIMHVQVGYELNPSRLWKGITNAWVTCQTCTRLNNWMSALLNVALALHIVTIILGIPWSCLKSFFFSSLPHPSLQWPSKTLLLNLVVLCMYLAVSIMQHYMEQGWQLPREGDTVFPSEIAKSIADVADTFTLLLVVLALLLATQVSSQTFSELGPAMVRLARLLAFVAVIMVPFSLALYQLGSTVVNLSTVEDSMLVVIAAFLGEIDVTQLLATTRITGLVLFFLLFTVFTLLLFPFVVEVLTYRSDPPMDTPHSPKHLRLYSERLAMVLSIHIQQSPIS